MPSESLVVSSARQAKRAKRASARSANKGPGAEASGNFWKLGVPRTQEKLSERSSEF